MSPLPRADRRNYLVESDFAPEVDVVLCAVVEPLPDVLLLVGVEGAAGVEPEDPGVPSVPAAEAPSEAALPLPLPSSFSFLGGIPVDDFPRLSVT
jgi:hypothetical protein